MQMKESLVKSRPLWGSVLAHKAEMFSHRGFTNGFFFAHLFPTPRRTPHDSRGRKWGRSEENRDTVCNCVIDDDECAD